MSKHIGWVITSKGGRILAWSFALTRKDVIYNKVDYKLWQAWKRAGYKIVKVKLMKLIDVNLRKSVKWFAEGMEKVLKENDHKGGWDQDDLGYFFNRLKEEMRELREKLPQSMMFEDIKDIAAVIKECHDIANFAHMIADNAKRIKEGL